MYQFVENIQSDQAFFFYRGMVALYALLKAMEIGPGDEVILQVFTCFHVPKPIVRLGATPIYVDIDPRTLSIDPGKIEEKITDRTRAIIVQHTFGIPAEMERILDIARKYDLWMIEDCCHALGSKYNGQEVGTFGDAAFYSFGWHKALVLGNGGAAVVNTPDLRQKVKELYKGFVMPPFRELVSLYLQYIPYSLFLTPALFAPMRDIYRNPHLRHLVAGISGSRKTTTPRVGKLEPAQDRKMEGGTGIYNKRMMAFQTKRLFRKLAEFDGIVAHGEWVVSRYKELFSQTGYGLLELDGRFEPVYYKYPLLSDRKKDIFETARQARIELSELFISPLYPPWHKRLWESLGYREGMCPISEDMSDRVVPLSVHSRVEAKDIERTSTFLPSFQCLVSLNVNGVTSGTWSYKTGERGRII